MAGTSLQKNYKRACGYP